MKPHWRWFLAGIAAALGVALLGLIFVAYRMPELLLNWDGLRYCG